jgi:hypothetical protein
LAITASGIYLPTFEKALIDTFGKSWEAEDNNVLLVNDTHTPDFTAHDFHADLTNIVSGTGWAAAGVALTGTELTLASGTVTFDATDVSETGTTLTDAMAAVLYNPTPGTSATNHLMLLSDFVTAVSTSAGTFAIQWSVSGIATFDLTP